MTSRYWSGRGGIRRGGLYRGIPPSWSLGRPRNPDVFGYEDCLRSDSDRRDMEIHQWHRDCDDELIMPRNRPYVADALMDDARGLKRSYSPPPLISSKRFQASTYSVPLITGPTPCGQIHTKDAAAIKPRDTYRPTCSSHIFRGELHLSQTIKTRYGQAVGLIFCDIKESLCRKNVAIETKKVKEKICERLNGILLDKIVPTPEEMHRMYRAKYGAEDDDALLMDIENSVDQDFADYMNGNLSAVLNSKLDDMFNKINKLYMEEAKTSNGNSERIGEDIEMIEEEPERKETAVKEYADYYRLLDYMLKERLPEVLPQFKRHMISILCHDPRFTYTDDDNGQEQMPQNQEKEKT